MKATKMFRDYSDPNNDPVFSEVRQQLWGFGPALTTGNPGSVIVPQYSSSKITVFVWGKNTILKFLGNTK